MRDLASLMVTWKPWFLGVVLAVVLSGTGPTLALAGSADDAGGNNPAGGGGAATSTEVHGDWNVVCRQDNEGEHCILSQVQTVRDSGQQALAIELQTVSVQDDEEGRTGADPLGLSGVLALPFGLALEAGVRLSFGDEGESETLPFLTCLPEGCLVPLAFDADAVSALLQVSALQVRVWSAADGEEINLSISLEGFADALADAAESVRS